MCNVGDSVGLYVGDLDGALVGDSVFVDGDNVGEIDGFLVGD